MSCSKYPPILTNEIFVNPELCNAYQDDDWSLSPNVKDAFEQEANFFSAETIFQGANFRKRARDFTAKFNSVFHLADLHGASRQATTWRFVEEQDLAVAALHHYPSSWQIDESGNPILLLWKVTPSPKFLYLGNDLDIPSLLRSDHPWAQAREMDRIVSGSEKISCGLNGSIRFLWQSWWNGHALIVILRRRPPLRII
ncbi:MAG: hypothetical protein HY659_06325 [Rhizobiales bacterium]|nr:hypothetical protein [Hyphomicrobiales bacterium]